ncbi:MAG: hypothetical protein ACPG06_02480 [Alphaproteobacteria bacterium]
MSAKFLATVIGAAMLAHSASAFADDYTIAADALCERIKSCTLVTLRRGGSSGADQRVVMNALDNMCVGIQQSYVAEPGGELYGYATSCLWSMAVLDCEALTQMDTDQPTEACNDYRNAVAYGYR